MSQIRVERFFQCLNECRDWSDWEQLHTRFRMVEQWMSLRERDQAVIGLERKAIELDMAEYIEREEALQWVCLGLYLASEEHREKMPAADFDSHIRLIIDGLTNREWGHEHEQNMCVLLGVVRQGKEKLIDAIARTLREDGEARRVNGKATGFGGKRWERLFRIKEQRAKKTGDAS
jgi:hypothetical protein